MSVGSGDLEAALDGTADEGAVPDGGDTRARKVEPPVELPEGRLPSRPEQPPRTGANPNRHMHRDRGPNPVPDGRQQRHQEHTTPPQHDPSHRPVPRRSRSKRPPTPTTTPKTAVGICHLSPARTRAHPPFIPTHRVVSGVSPKGIAQSRSATRRGPPARNPATSSPSGRRRRSGSWKPGSRTRSAATSPKCTHESRSAHRSPLACGRTSSRLAWREEISVPQPYSYWGLAMMESRDLETLLAGPTSEATGAIDAGAYHFHQSGPNRLETECVSTIFSSPTHGSFAVSIKYLCRDGAAHRARCHS